MIDLKIITLRHELHKNPELSNDEYWTSEHIESYLKELLPDKIINLGNTGLACIFDSQNAGETLMFRAELDALPIAEESNLSYCSVNENISHACGHDGHIAIIAGLAMKISQNRPRYGRVILLFQPAEEAEQGARDIVKNPAFATIEPDLIFGLHNIPRYSKHTVLLRNGNFTSASMGMSVRLFGKTAHAAEPENGINPSIAISKIIDSLSKMIDNKTQFSSLAFLTFIYIKMGEKSFGTSAGYGEIGLTLRAFENNDMALLTQNTEKIIKEICKIEKLRYEINYDEIFPAIENDNRCIELIKHAAKKHDYPIQNLEQPFRWSEDFGYYTNEYNGGFFGLGSGIDQVALHNPDFDFPDDILETGINIFYEIYQRINIVKE